jgi:agmatine/peptidylarginine deiminase
MRGVRLALAAAVALALAATGARRARADDAAARGAASPGQLSPFAEYFRPGSDDVLLAPESSAPRRLRGDYEPIDLLVLVHNPEWEGALRFMVERARTRVPVEVLIPSQERNTAEFRAWSKTRCVSVEDVKLNTPWIRDYGPQQVFEGLSVTWLDYTYYEDRRLDDDLPVDLADAFHVPLHAQEVHVDGGGLVSNGRGLCAMTDTSLADAGMHLASRRERERFVAELGCRGLAVLPALPREQTGHADVVVQFLSPDVVAVAAMDAGGSASDAELLDLTAGALRRTARALGQPLRIVRVPMHARGQVFYSYLNSLRVADLLFVPDYRDVAPALQAAAHGVLRAALPGVKLVPVPADSMVSLGGALHCIALGLNTPPSSAHPNDRARACPRAAPTRLARRQPARRAPAH